MRTVFDRFDRLRLLALTLWVLPVVALLPLGILWLWQSDTLFWWLIAMMVCAALGYGLQYVLLRHDRKLLTDAVTQKSARWPPNAENVWAAVERLAAQTEPEDWPLNDGSRLWMLGRSTLKVVARCYYPGDKQPLLQLTVPHTLLIIERASRDLRADIAENIPFSHRLTIGDLFRVWRWKAPAERLLNAYRAGRLMVNPADALLSEIWGHVRNKGYGMAWAELHCWLLREYVRKVGYYAIELYSGQLLLDDADLPAKPAAVSREDLQQSQNQALIDEPLRIVVLGRANAGKSSLINALFGRLITATDCLPDTTMTLVSHRLERDGLEAALIFDTPGYDTERFDWQVLKQNALKADLILWVCAAHRADRAMDRLRLDELQADFKNVSERHPPPIMLVLSHIDQLHPFREWRPPYDLLNLQGNPQRAKAVNIRNAVEAVALDLDIPIADVIPVCLAEGRVYNVDDVLWTVILGRQDAIGKARFLRCLGEKKRAENWILLRRQLVNTGRWLLGLPKYSGTH
ncbi:MAG: GTP-binding protein HSR1 [Candidatus Contendobacter odensis]|uniref:GTP-binding protein HSR1 n=1 Tax=Candidatus Contendibacter odensensis TaxID=1400860 RepID=A0A2G6PFT7_9GAMM|nr:MAG: GTP-binding protein HSR1 [Candidatus Contendobacter odensis]